MEWLVFDVDGVLIDVSESFDVAVKLTVERILEKFDRQIELRLKHIRRLRDKGIFSNDFRLSKALALGIIKYGDSDEFVKAFPENVTKKWIEKKVGIYIGDDTVKKIFNSYYFGEGYEDSSYNFEPIYKREKRIIDIELLDKVNELYNLGIITGRDKKEMKLAEEIIGYRFDKVITRDKIEKPDSECIERIVKTENGIYIGDTETDRLMVDNFNSTHENQVEFYKVTENNDVNKILKEIIEEKKCSSEV